jgi:uncharacterized protein YaiE (UPF0345 family)
VSGSGVFLQTDPIPGGSANNYDYVNQNPINGYDLAGTCAHGWGWACHTWKTTKNVASKVYQHTNISEGQCVIVCLGLGFQGGHFYGSFGAWGIATPGVNVNYASRTFSHQNPESYEIGGGIAYGVNGSVGIKKNGSPDWGDWQAGVSFRPGGFWAGNFRTFAF